MEWELGEIVSDWDIVQKVKKIHYRRQDFEDGDIRERIEKFDLYILKEIPLDQIEKVWTYIDDDLVEEYMEEDSKTMPPIVLGEYWKGKYEIVDGGHRVETKREKEEETIFAYVPYMK